MACLSCVSWLSHIKALLYETIGWFSLLSRNRVVILKKDSLFKITSISSQFKVVLPVIQSISDYAWGYHYHF